MSSHNRSESEEEEIPFLSPEPQDVVKKSKPISPSIQELMYVGASAFMLVASLVIAVAGSKYPTDAQCINKMSTWSPMLEAVEYEWRHFKEEAPNAYYGKPTADLEKAWGDLWQCKSKDTLLLYVLIFFFCTDGSAGVPDSKLDLLNKSRDIDWKHLPDELGGGIEAFFEGFHQIHCVVITCTLFFSMTFIY